MPYYNYCCPNCGYEIHDVKQTLDEHDKEMICPKCKTEMEQVFDTMHFMLNGDGWTGPRSR